MNKITYHHDKVYGLKNRPMKDGKDDSFGRALKTNGCAVAKY